MKRFWQVLIVLVAAVVFVGLFLGSGYAGVWFVHVVSPAAVCAPVVCAPAVCAPAACTPTVVSTPAVCVASPCCVVTPVKPCNPQRISFWTGPARPGGEPTYHEYNTQTGQFNQIIDVGLNASGQSAIQLTNTSGGWTILKQKVR